MRGNFSGVLMDSVARSTSRSGQYRWLGFGHSTCIISDTEASWNQGNSLNGTKSSLSPKSSQNPCLAMFVTSIPEMFFPSATDFIRVVLCDGFVIRTCRAIIFEGIGVAGCGSSPERSVYAATDCHVVFTRFCSLSGIVAMTDRRKVLTASEERKTEATSGSRMTAMAPVFTQDINRFGLAVV